MAYSAFAIANAFVHRAIQGHLPNLTPMKLQKLMYFAQAWHIKGTQGTPLLDDHFARWQYGPVIPAIYHEFKAFGYMPINRMATTLATNGDGYRLQHVPTVPFEDKSTWSLIDAIINRYGKFDGPTLSEMTHLSGSAWSKVAPDGSVITAQEMLEDNTM